MTFNKSIFKEYSVQVTFREQWNDERLQYVDSTKGESDNEKDQTLLQES